MVNKKKVPAENTILQCKIYIKLLQILNTKWGQDSADGIATTTGWTVWGPNPSRGKIFHTSSDLSWGPPILPYEYWASFLGVKWLGHSNDFPPPSSAKVKERVDLYRYSARAPSWPVEG